MEIKLTTLCENTVAGPGFIGEWGLSVLVQVDDHNILFDTGAESAAVKNADKIGFDLKTIDTIILSHAHHDHTGGLREVLKRTEHPTVITHPALWFPKFKKGKTNGPMKFNGIPFRREEIEKAADLRLSTKPVELSDAVLTTGEIPLTSGFETVGNQYFIKDDGDLRPDYFADEQALTIKTAEGLIIVSGCAHRGIINTIRQAQDVTGEKTVHTVIGGTHLYEKNRSDVDKTISELLAMEIQNIGVSHCTGMDAAMKLADALGDRFFLNNAGHVFSVRINGSIY